MQTHNSKLNDRQGITISLFGLAKFYNRTQDPFCNMPHNPQHMPFDTHLRKHCAVLFESIPNCNLFAIPSNVTALLSPIFIRSHWNCYSHQPPVPGGIQRGARRHIHAPVQSPSLYRSVSLAMSHFMLAHLQRSIICHALCVCGKQARRAHWTLKVNVPTKHTSSITGGICMRLYVQYASAQDTTHTLRSALEYVLCYAYYALWRV